MIVTVYDNLNSKATTDDGSLECNFPTYNVISMTPFTSKEEVEEFVTAFMAEHPECWSTPVTQEQIDAEKISKNTAKATEGLKATDWVENASVRDTTVVPHLANAAEFDAYRLALRAIIVNKVANVEEFPVAPEEVWTTV